MGWAVQNFLFSFFLNLASPHSVNHAVIVVSVCDVSVCMYVYVVLNNGHNYEANLLRGTTQMLLIVHEVYIVHEYVCCRVTMYDMGVVAFQN